MNFLPLYKISSPGASSVPANIPPSITQSAPAAIAFTTSPDNLIPPSAITPIPFSWQTSATCITAEIWGTPTPATTLVVQIEPGPTPTFTAFTPASIKSRAASGVTIFPPIISKSGNASLISLILSITPLECPCAESTAIISTPASTNAFTLLTESAPTPTPAPTLNLPWASFAALG